MFFVLYGLFVRFRQAHCTPNPTRRGATRITQKEHLMNTSRSTRFGLIARSTLGAMAFVSLVGVAQSQTTSAASMAVPAEKDTSKDVQKFSRPGQPVRLGRARRNTVDPPLAEVRKCRAKCGRAEGGKGRKAAPTASVVEVRTQSAEATH